ncbi:MAG TPA: 2-phospho-L-lactate guanylyltransferase [Rhizobiaceae bacterium]|nr:2-phospho-L-lactate guanylyltransferase [Rhizobiaceae bacterium]
MGSSRTICALVPVKHLRRAKSRLAALLTDTQRVALAEAMLLDVLEVLSRTSGLAGIAVVTGDTAVADIARRHGATVIDDPAEDGTNQAVEIGLRKLAGEGWAGALIVPGDVPFLSTREVETALIKLDHAAVVIVPANRDGGTNLLALAPCAAIEPAFGPDSFNRHVAAAMAAGMNPLVLSFEGAGHDIDVPGDLWAALGGGPASRTRAWLSRLGFKKPPVSAGRSQEAFLP